jgi:hypothetical protein
MLISRLGFAESVGVCSIDCKFPSGPVTPGKEFSQFQSFSFTRLAVYFAYLSMPAKKSHLDKSNME